MPVNYDRLVPRLEQGKRILRQRLNTIIAEMAIKKYQIAELEQEIATETKNMQLAAIKTLLQQHTSKDGEMVFEFIKEHYSDELPILETKQDIRDATAIVVKLNEALELVRENYELSCKCYEILRRHHAATVVVGCIARSCHVGPKLVETAT
ncbi:hypothetical protein Poli38472_009714 [Pythium oligandrum]|uniref:Uncharacterized protein n=1 Tax=Pythium oligandrum TaxID=41045 RepID=A0A8K1FH11_PYTOL|nr:hypothetical protein Poli38472_009714 [Pythium oligandrum]|eukprot:TMW62221.1 hypothetical protein Poli38472_009714 [Pythium oligandrum]